MPTITERIAINAPIERVFGRLAEPERAPEWTPNLVSVERTSAATEGTGVETTLVARVAGRPSRGQGRCLAWEPPGRLVLQSSLDVRVTSTTTFDLAGARRVSS